MKWAHIIAGCIEAVVIGLVAASIVLNDSLSVSSQLGAGATLIGVGGIVIGLVHTLIEDS